MAMNDLDKRIAELKGWRKVTVSDLERIAILEGRGPTTPYRDLVRDRPDGGMDLTDEPPAGSPTWSTSDAKAFELVDEIMRADPKVCFNLDHHYGSLYPWNARFRIGFGIVGEDFTGAYCDGQTRPDAICRAYIAAIEWMKGKKK